MSDYKKIITAQESTVSFLPKNIISRFGKAPTICAELLTNFKRVLILCTDQAYFALGKRVKDELILNQKEVSCFCFDSEVVERKILQKVIDEDLAVDCILAIGEDTLLSSLLSVSNKHTIFLPLSFEFSALLQMQNAKDFTMVFDSEVFSSLSKNKILSGVKSILSKNILFIESVVNELIGGLLCQNEAISLLKEASEMLSEFIMKKQTESLIKAQLYASFAASLLPLHNVPFDCAVKLNDLQGIAEFGEREYMFYQMIIKIYALYLNNDTSFLVKLPTAMEIFEQDGGNLQINAPDFLFNQERLAYSKAKVCENQKLKDRVNLYLKRLESNEKIFYSIYAGRKYTVQNYNAKERVKALNNAHLNDKKVSLFKLIWADGLLEYI